MIPARMHDTDRMKRDLAAFVGGVITLDRLRSLHGANFLAELTDDDWDQAEERAAAAEMDGTALRGRAREVLGQAVRRIAKLVDEGEIAPGVLIKAAELLCKLAGLSDEPEPVRGQFAINIVLSDGKRQPLGAVEADVVSMRELPHER